MSMYRRADYAVHIELNVTDPGRNKPLRMGVRKFIVEYDADGEAIRIKEIRQLQKPQVGFYHQTYWNSRNHPRGGLPERIIAAANAKVRREELAADATP